MSGLVLNKHWNLLKTELPSSCPATLLSVSSSLRFGTSEDSTFLTNKLYSNFFLSQSLSVIITNIKSTNKASIQNKKKWRMHLVSSLILPFPQCEPEPTSRSQFPDLGFAFPNDSPKGFSAPPSAPSITMLLLLLLNTDLPGD